MPRGPSAPQPGAHVALTLCVLTSTTTVPPLSSRFVKNSPCASSTAYPSGDPSVLTTVFIARLDGLEASSTVTVWSFGVVTQASLTAATYATPSVPVGSLRHLPGL